MSGEPADWPPSASLDALRARAALLERVRAFFAARGVLEVETPVLGSAGATDVHLRSLETRAHAAGAPERLFLQTSPELAMKRLLAAGSGPIYQIARCFRDGEAGRLHNPEFTLVEWYRPGFDHHDLMDEVDAFLDAALERAAPSRRLRWAEAFERCAGVDPWSVGDAELARRCGALGLDAGADLDRAARLGFLFERAVQPALGAGRVFVHDFPEWSASLARVRDGDPPVAERFELYLDGLEIANGYRELADPAEQRRRQERDRAARRAAGLADVPVDERVLAALAAGLPECAGVALGLDRVVMAALGVDRLDAVVAFPVSRA